MRKVKQNINTLISLGDKVQAIAGADHNRSGARMIGKQVTILQKATSETTTAANQNADGDHHEVQGVEDPVAPATATARAGGRQGHHAAGGRVAPRRDPIPLPGSQGKRELGTVTVCKQHFGFIKCVERMGDLFFHESAVRRGEDGEAVDKVGPGDDVEFSVGQDPKTKQKIAYEYVVLRVLCGCLCLFCVHVHTHHVSRTHITYHAHILITSHIPPPLPQHHQGPQGQCCL